jgi:hypothetical protein
MLVSKCCGSDYEDSTVSWCCSAQISESGICYECKEHTDSEGYECIECSDWLDEIDLEPLDDYNDRMRENALEDKADAKRKYNE